jgi:hypothetical protein
MPGDHDGIISKDDLNQRSDLFSRFEGALDPLSPDCKDAEYQFNALVQHLHLKKVKPVLQTISLTQFHCEVRNQCRKVVSKRGPRYTCINPEIHFSDSVPPINPLDP